MIQALSCFSAPLLPDDQQAVEHIPQGYFRMRYSLHGKNWLTTISQEDRHALAMYACKCSDYGRQGARKGGLTRSSSAMRDNRGRFISASSIKASQFENDIESIKADKLKPDL